MYSTTIASVAAFLGIVFIKNKKLYFLLMLVYVLPVVYQEILYRNKNYEFVNEYIYIISNLKESFDLYFYFILLIPVFSIFFERLIIRFTNPKSIKNTSSINIKNLIIKLNKRRAILIVIFYISVALLIISIDGIENLFFPPKRFFSINEKVTLASQFFINACYVLLYLIYRARFSKSSILFLALNFVIALLYPLSISSRAVVFVPLIIFCVELFIFRSKFMLFAMGFVCFFGYLFALTSRGNIGLDNFFSNAEKFLSVDYFLLIKSSIYNTFIGVSGLTLALDAVKFDLYSSSNPIDFLIYLSPIPSILLPAEVFSKVSYSGVFGFVNVGINVDLVSEMYLWFKSLGLSVAALILGLMFGITSYFLNKQANELIKFSAFFAFLYFLLLSQQAPLRAASRPMIYLLIILMVINIFNRFKSKRSFWRMVV